MLTSTIDTDDYAIIKKDCEVELGRLESNQSDYASNPVRLRNSLTKQLISWQIGVWFQNTDNERKRAIMDSMHPEKLSFDGEVYRTTRLNKMIEKKSLIFSALAVKKGKN
jgi:hypothetical protein